MLSVQRPRKKRACMRTSHWIIIVIVGAIIAGSITGWFVFMNDEAKAAAYSWSVTPGTLSQRDHLGLESAIASLERSDHLPPEAVIEVTTARVEDNLAVLYGVVSDASQDYTILAGEGYAAIGQRDGDVWTVLSPDDSGFCEALDQASERLISATAKDYFVGCQSMQTTERR